MLWLCLWTLRAAGRLKSVSTRINLGGDSMEIYESGASGNQFGEGCAGMF